MEVLWQYTPILVALRDSELKNLGISPVLLAVTLTGSSEDERISHWDVGELCVTYVAVSGVGTVVCEVDRTVVCGVDGAVCR